MSINGHVKKAVHQRTDFVDGILGKKENLEKELSRRIQNGKNFYNLFRNSG